MIIQCDKCNTKFRLDESRVTGHGVKVRCTKCQNVFIVTPPPVEEAQVEEVFHSEEPAKKAARQEAQTPKQDDPNLKFDFGSGNAGEDILSSKPGEKEEEKPAPKSFNDIDFSFAQDKPADEEKAFQFSESKEPMPEDEDDVYQIKNNAAPAEEKSEGNDIDFNFDDEEEKEAKEDSSKDFSLTDDWGLGSTEDEQEENAERKQSAPPQEKPENVIPFASGYTKQGKPAAPAFEEDLEDDDDNKAFADVLKRSSAKDEPELPEEDEGLEERVAAAVKPRPKKMGLIIAVLVFILGGGLIYYTGIIDTLAKKLMPPSDSEMQKVVEIETVNGFFVENKIFGKVFVVEAKIKNITDAPQSVKAVTGVIYDKSGEKLATRSVSPGRIVTADDLRNLPREDLLKPFNDPSGGMIPPKGTVPIMVPFTEIPEGMSEYGIDIVR
ncbi:MAG: zinc-ribbon domain-containing protein [Deltaproteobacteria bacterium]|nr:zinc-ribbon domain-containing protein [Deltaproteobacteria bacterium]